MNFFEIKPTESEMRNILQGLELLHGKCMDQIQALPAFEPMSVDIKKYYKEKQVEISTQISETRKLLLNSKL